MLEDAFTQADYAINITDTEGRLLRVNSAYLSLYKFSSESEVLGKTQRIIRSPLTPDSLYKEMWRTISGGETWRGNLINRASDGESVHIHLTITPIHRGGQVAGYMGFSLDRAQQVLLEQQLLHANKLMVLGTLGAGLAHEMNNPLASILLEAEYLKKQLSLTENSINRKGAEQAADSIVRGVDRMRRVLNHLLQYSRKDAAEEVGSVPVRRLLEDTFLFLDRQLMNRGIEVRVEAEESLALRGNRTQIESVLHNLISNSRDAFGEEPGQGRLIVIRARALQEGLVEILFEDNAGGIPAGTVDRIFEPFFTTKDGAAGTGLGLSLSRKIVNDHGGTIQCESQDGRTRFTILLPAAAGSF